VVQLRQRLYTDQGHVHPHLSLAGTRPVIPLP
jgi:hypothetical protein